MEPNLLIGDRLFVSKYTYGFSRHSFPFSPKFTNKRYFKDEPKRGDIIVFKTPSDNRTDFIKRLIGMPNDSIQIISGELYINDSKILREKILSSRKISCGDKIIESETYKETLPNGVKYVTVYSKDFTMMNTDKFVVPENHYFFMGDNRDCSRDSRFLSSVGYVHINNLVGKARLIFFSNDNKISSFLKFWNWNKSVRLKRFFKKIK